MVDSRLLKASMVRLDDIAGQIKDLKQGDMSNGSRIESAQQEIATLRYQREQDTRRMEGISLEVQGSLDTLRYQGAVLESRMADAVVAAASSSERVQKELSDIRYGIQRAVQLSEGASMAVEEVTSEEGRAHMASTWRTEVVTEVRNELKAVHDEMKELRYDCLLYTSDAADE